MKNIQKLVILLAVVTNGIFLPANGYTQARETQKITGTVVDTKGEVVIGASISVLGTSLGTVTDINGAFELTIPEGSTLKVSYIGFNPYQEKTTAQKTTYPVTLQEDFQSLEEVVVVGYGTQKRSELTGSISSVRTNNIKDFSAKSLAEALSGMAAGVMVTKGDGSPGSSADIIIRGAASINGIKPLYIVDGIRQETGFEFNMRDVESIEILKDAGSSAIYGAQAAGGVILITTKRGAAGKTNVSVNARYGVRDIYSNIKLLNRDEFIRARSYMGTDILSLEGVSDYTDPETGQLVTAASQLPDVDWMGLMYSTGIEQEYNVSVSGATEKANFFLSSGFYDEEGVFLDTSAKRFSFRTNLDYKLNKWITIGESLYGNLRKDNPNNNYSVYGHSLPFRTVPTMEALDTEQIGGYAHTPSYLNGPNLYGVEKIYHYTNSDYRMNASAYINWKIIDGLDLRLTGAGNFYGFSNNAFSEAFDFRAIKEDEYMTAAAGTSQDLTFNAVLTYEKIWGDHNVKVMAGTEAIRYDGYRLDTRAIDFPIPLAESINLSSNPAKTVTDVNGTGRSQSFFGRLNYSYLGKYLITANIRRDGSDKFGPQNRWGNFPSINGAWRISEEAFIKDNIDWLSNAKLRGSWGILGNDGIPQFLYQEAYIGTQIIYSFGGGEQQQGWANFKVPNEKIKWEEVNQTDIGIDLGFLNNRLSFTYDFYNRQTKDMLYQRTVPLGGGIGYYTSINTTMPINIGQVENMGHELTLTWNDRLKDFNYSISGNISFNKNKVIEIGEEGAAPILSGNAGVAWGSAMVNRTENGNAMGLFYGYRAIGIFSSQEEVDAYNAKAVEAGSPNGYYWREGTGVGDIIYDDLGQGWVDANSQTYIGNPWPKAIAGFNVNMEYKGFDLSLLFQGAFGFDIFNGVKAYTQVFGEDGNTTADIFKNSFFGENELTDMPRCGKFDDKGQWIGDSNISRNYSTVSSFWVEKGDYLKLKNLVFGYSLPKNISQKVHIEKARVYISGQNLLTLTKYTGIDPEIAGDVLARGIDLYNRYLPSRLISFGLDVTF
ncbi:MAG: TonB-dependent receptor [Dysgonamonadaceae bacterium]|nr:TonB-dependent receptor [Dysgonamonadaceae bacterium]